MSPADQKLPPQFKTVAVIGLGYVGLPLCLLMYRAGYQVLGVDCDPAKVETLQQGLCYLKHIGESQIRTMCESGRFDVTTDESRLAEADAVLICVPTPLNEQHEPDLTHVIETTVAVSAALKARGASQLIVLESTTFPGTTRDVLKPILDNAAQEYHLAFSPERVDPGRDEPPLEEIPKVVGGIDHSSSEAARTLYQAAFSQIHVVSSPDVAEAAKLMENIFRAVNIALVNEMKVGLDRMGIDVWEVIQAAETKPYGFMPFYPGPGLGGHCIPIDPFYFAWKARQVGTSARFIELAGTVNRAMPDYVVYKALESIGRSAVDDETSDHDGSVRILILGLAYKPDIDDVRESPSFELIRLFRKAGCEVSYSDPHVPATHHMRHYGDLNMNSLDLSPEILASFDAVVIATDHNAFDWDLIVQHATLIIDTRNRLQDFEHGHIVRA